MLALENRAQVIDLRSLNLPYTIKLYGVTDEMFDELANEDIKAELLDGVMTVHSPASMRHDLIGHFLRSLLGDYAEEKELGAVYGPDSIVRLRRGRRFAPDLFFLSAARIPLPTPQEYDGAPDLVLEVLSPSNRDDDLGEKRTAYQEAGVPEIWFVDAAEEQILIDRKRRKTYATETITAGRAASSVAAGFWIDAAWLWADPLPKRRPCLRAILK